MDFNSLLPLLKILTSTDGQKVFFLLVVCLTIIVAAIRIVLRINLGSLISQVKKLIYVEANNQLYAEANNQQQEAQNQATNQAKNQKTSGSVVQTLKDPIQEAEERIRTYEKRADTFNASVIVDQVYSSNKLWIASRDSWDFVCRSFPNVLISLGLLGTFIGITSNLSSIQGILNNSTGTTEQITARLQEPLNGMATAFGSSLIALFCGISLTFVNLIWNTTVAKYRFLSLLEDYLNTKVARTPTGTVLTEIQDSLKSFRKEMADIFLNQIATAIGKSFNSQIAQITKENERLTANLNALVTGFSDSSTKFENAAVILSGSNLPNNINNFFNTIKQFQQAIQNLDAQFADSSTSIADSSTSIAASSQKFQQATEKLDAHSKSSIELIKLTQSNQKSLLDAMPSIKQAAKVLGEIQLSLEASANNFETNSRESILLKNELNTLTQNVKLLAEKITQDLYQGIDFDTLHKDNEKIIDLNQKIIDLLKEINKPSRPVNTNWLGRSR